MPIVMIHSLPPADSTTIPRMLADIRDSGAQALRCPTNNIWVMFQELPASHYLQGDVPAQHPQEKSHPPVVIIKANAGRSLEDRKAFVEEVAAAVGRGMSVSSKQVWIHYQEMRLQDVWFNGDWAGK